VACGIHLENVSLLYPAVPAGALSIKEMALSLARPRSRRPRRMPEVCALRDLTLDVRDGERLGIVGRNGAGKSTILKVIAGIYPVRSGTVRVRGRIQSLFDLSLGFEPEATGRDNITYRGLLMGAKPAELAVRGEEIAVFADLGEFIDYPVKTYSAGMLVRLAFAISTSFGGDILLMDEVINAGDAFFMAKARKRLLALVSSSHIMMLVSHDLGAIRDLCSRAILLEHGRIAADGPPAEVVAAYLASGG